MWWLLVVAVKWLKYFPVSNQSLDPTIPKPSHGAKASEAFGLLIFQWWWWWFSSTDGDDGDDFQVLMVMMVMVMMIFQYWWWWWWLCCLLMVADFPVLMMVMVMVMVVLLMAILMSLLCQRLWVPSSAVNQLLNYHHHHFGVFVCFVILDNTPKCGIAIELFFLYLLSCLITWQEKWLRPPLLQGAITFEWAADLWQTRKNTEKHQINGKYQKAESYILHF